MGLSLREDSVMALGYHKKVALPTYLFFIRLLRKHFFIMHVQAVSLEQRVIDDRVCSALSCNVDLQYLNLTMCQGLSPDGIRAILQGCRRCCIYVHVSQFQKNKSTFTPVY